MPPTNSSARSPSEPRRARLAALLLAGSMLLPALSAVEPLPPLMPLPAQIQPGEGRLTVTAGFGVAFREVDDPRLRAAVARGLARWAKRTGLSFDPAPVDDSASAALVIACAAAAPAVPRLGDDESYTLEISPRQAVLRAATTTGALRGLETVLQLLAPAGGGFALPAVTVRDQPRFPWRGLMIDVARHWQPVDVIERTLDAMALVKLNVLHLHLTDDQGFRIESLTHPELHTRGSDGHFFTQEQMRGIIAFAAARGIRVVPEFDIPGHATSWVVSHPELASAPGPYAIERRWGVFDPVLDPTNEQTYALLADFLGEMAALFPDEFLHIGGDENNGVQWNANPAIQAFIRDHGLGDNAGLHAHFNRRVSEILQRHGRRLVGWDEILHPDLPAGSVVHSWRGPEGIAAAAARGHPVILSNGYYIDLNFPASDHYLNDPLPADTPLPPERWKLVLGGEATMWAEWVTPELIDSRLWPRTAAIAERLWSPRDMRDVPDMYRRLAAIDLRLQEAGTLQGRWPRIALPGLDPAGPVAHALRTLASLVEPVKRYERGGLQPAQNQLSPLDELADWSRPDSAPARIFASAVDRWLFADGELDGEKSAALSAVLDSWRAAGELAATAPAAATPIAQGRVAAARALVDLAAAGGEAIDALRSRQPLAPARLAAARAALDRAAQPTAAAVEFPFLPALRLLVTAAGEPTRRDESPRAEWKRHLQALAGPPDVSPPPPAH